MNLMKECNDAKRIGITGHIRPDGDCVGSCLALSLYLHKVCPKADITVYLEKPLETFQMIKDFNLINSKYEEIDAHDVFFILDANYDRIGDAQKYFNQAQKTINIDHHISNKGSAEINYIIPNASSTSELIYDLIEEEYLDYDIAQAIYIGMIHDTGVFQYSNTEPKTLEIAGRLISYGFPFPKIIEETFYQKNYIQTQILGRALMESIRFMDGQCIVSCIDKKVMEFYNADAKDLDGIVNQLRNITGIHCAIFMYQTDVLEYKISMRSDECVNVSEIASYFGGGGHIRAAGCSMRGTVHDCINNLSLHIEKQLRKF